MQNMESSNYVEIADFPGLRSPAVFTFDGNDGFEFSDPACGGFVRAAVNQWERGWRLHLYDKRNLCFYIAHNHTGDNGDYSGKDFICEGTLRKTANVLGITFLGMCIVTTGGPAPWDDEQDSKLRDMILAGTEKYPPAEVARLMGRSHVDVDERMAFLDWKWTRDSDEAERRHREEIAAARGLPNIPAVKAILAGSKEPADLIAYAEATQSLKFPHPADYGKTMANYLQSLEALKKAASPQK